MVCTSILPDRVQFVHRYFFYYEPVQVFVFAFVLELFVELRHVVWLPVDVELRSDPVEHAEQNLFFKGKLKNVSLNLQQVMYEGRKYFHE